MLQQTLKAAAGFPEDEEKKIRGERCHGCVVISVLSILLDCLCCKPTGMPKRCMCVEVHQLFFWRKKIIQHQQTCYFHLHNPERKLGWRWGSLPRITNFMSRAPRWGACRKVPKSASFPFTPCCKLHFQHCRALSSLTEIMEPSRAQWGSVPAELPPQIMFQFP